MTGVQTCALPISVHGRVTPDTFQPAGRADTAARALLPRIEAELDVSGQGEGRGTFPMPGIVTMRDRKGRTVQKTVTYVKGHPKNPMTYEDVAEKFRVCARLGRPGWNGAEAVIEAVRNLEQLEDTSPLAALCNAAAAPQAARAA